MSRAVSLAAAIGLLIGGAIEASDTRVSAPLFTAGLITLGAWLAVEVWHHRDRADQPPADQDHDA